MASNYQMRIRGDLHRGDDEIRWQPVMAWETDPNTVKRRPSAHQATRDGLSVWVVELLATMVTYGRTNRELVRVQNLSDDEPDVPS